MTATVVKLKHDVHLFHSSFHSRYVYTVLILEVLALVSLSVF